MDIVKPEIPFCKYKKTIHIPLHNTHRTKKQTRIYNVCIYIAQRVYPHNCDTLKRSRYAARNGYTNDYRMVTMNDRNGRFTPAKLPASSPYASQQHLFAWYSYIDIYKYKGNVHNKPTPILAFINSVLLESNISLAKWHTTNSTIWEYCLFTIRKVEYSFSLVYIIEWIPYYAPHQNRFIHRASRTSGWNKCVILLNRQNRHV